jgi:predicted small secreted protein
MNHSMISTPRRRLAPALFVVTGLALSSGCNRDDTVRGAGSIDVPVENLKFQPTTKGSSKAPKAATRR